MITSIRNARILTMDDDLTEHNQADILVTGTKIAEIGSNIPLPSDSEPIKVIDATGMLAMPGLVNAHVHTPGRDHHVHRAVAQVEVPVLVEETQFQVAEVVEQQFIKMKDMLVGAIQIKTQELPSDFGKIQVVKNSAALPSPPAGHP